ncbi:MULTISPECIES: pitrilysin family protein [Corallococcus]|uniref:M16 family metallopeptidase n=1 Tax=Corallococcus TaxID=83461 RepID=UPI00117F417B|nr:MULTISPECIES: pitrilysin family protein [Corallococcus]NBD13711.1 insulinase family protein [Corallococcus silvisoli]TSC22806.1 insulinase family protein [Corallococcus sp. Z5C101001]
MFRPPLSWFACVALLGASQSWAQAPQPSPEAAASTPVAKLGASIQARTLKNGLTVVVWPDHDIPNVALANWFRVGSRNERPGITGLSHFFEHMMFNGAKKYGPGEFDRVMEAHGGANNAFTSEDVTVYLDWFPASALPLILDLEQDRLQSLAFDPKVIESERGVVYSERRSSVDNDNTGALMEQVQATAFVAHPYQIPVIGWPSDIESWRMEDLQRYFKTYYAPNNATLVIAGDVEPARLFEQVEATLGTIPAQPPPEPVRTKEPEQQGERRVIVKKLAQSPLLQVVYHGLSGNDPDAEALELLGLILTQGDSSRLHRKLVDEARVAIRVRSSTSGGFDPSLAWFLVDLPPGGDLAKTEALLTAELARVAKEGVTDAELRKARNVALAAFWRKLETNDGRARELGSAATFRGDWKALLDAPSRYEKVTLEGVHKLAARIFNSDHRTVGWLVPTTASSTPASKEGSR